MRKEGTTGRRSIPLLVSNLYKRYRGQKNYAVENFNLMVESGECFGLLGVNGAGKTTTFKILTGELQPSSGDAFIGGLSVIENRHEVQRMIGYCPQFDALFDCLSGREILTLYSRIKGYQSQRIKSIVETQLEHFNLLNHADKIASAYSGGNKRKLSAAIAFLGHPMLVFLDEPTAGMDPGAKRFLWTRIKEAVDRGQSVVLTSHCMEECEILCSRLTIMVKGQMQCIGTVQALKSRYGQGYTVGMRAKDIEFLADIEKKLLDSFPSCTFTSHFLNIQVKFPKESKLEDIFLVIEMLKNQMEVITDYSVNQTTIEEIFIDFADQDENPDQTHLVV
ncbi:ATP-binding cassette sub- A member 1 [Cichlidogyrus casuarinus]|uniref:ATP-binding cassette sub- A member 1 n=1 Tax=Cichlidogyrus casuarinus TaxID=1844966 RepID=A0ABD2PLG5_9PLAT